MPARAQVVISQVYGGGGNSGATYKSGFVELHNNGTQVMDLAGWSLQYASAADSSWQATPLAGSIAQLASGSAQRFVPQVPADAALAGRTLSLAASVKSQTPDPRAGNDNAAVSVAVEPAAAANLSLRIDGPRPLPCADYRIVLSNLGRSSAEAVQLRIDGSTRAGLASLQVPAGWRCVKASLSVLRPLAYRCSAAAALVPGNTTTFGVRVNRFPAPAGGIIRLGAAAAAATEDSDSSDNAAGIETRVCSWRGC